MADQPTLDERVTRIEQFLLELQRIVEERTDGLAARIEWMQIQAGQVQPRDTPPPNPIVAGRWFRRAGNIYGRYTYEGTHAPPEPILDRMDPQLRRSLAAME